MFKARIQGFIAGLLLAILLISTLVFATPAIREVFFGVNVVVNGELQPFDDDSRPFISEGRTFLPVRGIAEALGVAVNWDGDTQTVYIGGIPEISTNIGEIVEFGGIQWRVLDAQDGRTLLLSEYLLENRPFHYEWTEVTWETSDIRRWLNGEFYDQFVDEEQAKIAETIIINNDNPWQGTSGGNDTIDKIFFLSLEELVYYFGDSGALRGGNNWIDDQYNQARVARYTNRAFAWWLRSPGYAPGRVSWVSNNGTVWTGANPALDPSISIRPAMWVYL
ncbi:MAG: copper amine oxidase N-terminal domain-containing protein [Oscillospiraceae bacterium]|nr:copper amine oxidase N-terminal domain-containing protein [Oscillospiraceae bacterium]